MKRTFWKKLICVAAALCLLAALLPQAALAAETKTYLALGDSISGGYGLESSSQAFPSLLAGLLGEDYTLVNKATNEGETTATLLADLQTPEFQAAVAEADVISVTIGGNDLMALLYSFLAENLDMDVQAVRQALETGDQAVLAQAATILNEQDFAPSVMDYLALAKAFTSIITTLKTLNPDAQLIVATQYNPYADLTAQIQAIPPMFLTGNIKVLADAILKLSGTIESALNNVNTAVVSGAAASGYLVADVYTAFAESPDYLCNAAVSLMPSVSVNLDFHPNAAGHALIAQCMKDALPAQEPVEPPFDPEEPPVVEPENPNTGDSSQLFTWAAFMLLSGLACAAVLLNQKRFAS